MTTGATVQRIVIVLISAIIVASCATSPLGRSQLQLFSDETMSAMGADAFEQLKTQNDTARDQDNNAYVQCVAANVLSALPAAQGKDWEVLVFKEDSPNAFALPGRKIGVHTGLLAVAENQHQLATVIGHEVAHVTAEHGNERLSTSFATQTGLELASVIAADPNSLSSRTAMAMLGVGAQVGIILPFSRAQEQEADLVGLDLMAKAGFDPTQSVLLWRNMAQQSSGSPPEFLSTHPDPEKRIKTLQARLPVSAPLQKNAAMSGKVPDCSR